MKFLVDSAVSPEVAAGLRGHGHDAVHVADYGLAMASDETILMRAAAENRIVVTSDTDFGELMAESGASRPSIILFRRSSGKPVTENALLVRALREHDVCETLERGGIVVIDPRRFRIRRLPLGSPEE